MQYELHQEGGIGIFCFAVLDIFLIGFSVCVKRRRFFGFGVQCGLRIFRFLASGFRFFGFGTQCGFWFSFFFLFGPIWVYSFVCGFRFWPILFAILRFWMHFFFGFGFSSILQCPLHQLYNFGQFCVCGVIRLQLALDDF